MDRDEYGERLKGFESHVSAARIHSGILEEMIKDDPEIAGVLNTYGGFFVYVKAALHNGMLLAAAKALDRDARTASLPNLVKAAKESPEFALDVDLACIEEWMEAKASFIGDLILLRNKRLAHFDVPDAELPDGLTYGEFKDMLDALHKHSVALERAFHGIAGVMDLRGDEARSHTNELMRTLIDKRRSRLDELRSLAGQDEAPR